jgi:hypothetical protein
VARALSGQHGPQFPRGAVAIGDEGGSVPQSRDEPRGAALAGRDIAGEVHTANHALPRESGGALQQVVAALRNHVGEQVGHQPAVGRVSAGIGLVGLDIADAGLDGGLDLARPQAPEALLGGAHVLARLVFHRLGQAGNVWQTCEGALVDA